MKGRGSWEKLRFRGWARGMRVEDRQPGSGATYPINGRSTTRAGKGSRHKVYGPEKRIPEGHSGWREAGHAVISRPSNKPSADDMTTFDERKDAFEKRFALDEELRFKATARRN